MLTKALTIAGSDSGGGAGIQADLKTFAALNVYGMSALTAITAQNTCGVTAVQAIDPDVVEAQIRAVVSDIGVDAIKTGMLFSAPIIDCVARAIRDLTLPNVVVDPVMVATSGDRLLQPDAEESLRTALLPLAAIVTPNLNETAVLVGHAVKGLDAMQAAAETIVGTGVQAVLVKGGHATEKATDVFYDGTTMELLTAEVVETNNTHGTGCTLSSAIAAYLARGLPLLDAVRQAKSYLTEALKQSLDIGQGSGPVGHFWNVTYQP
ncbi:MAG: phosphomethylpyrimidine kinase [Candidatus Entotheonella factor]|uniref:hydroxymethylpyrimidine kinase n=1 Tax=Entotheonella factor TaxID=1429438 RepID=W4LZ70_ENTF1|nr:bifunctional hydroxymethylpyrimidine kinase/phosphomethylpyrimidine kinase [Candidatus Entotheonella palauensis]ETX03230.1 MAG: phosphomethylpyrimidine kinase [Candidatus Entotheonella factor]